ncbi:MAG: hypothetical protein WBI82_06415 [Sphaerochaeta sp.]
MQKVSTFRGSAEKKLLTAEYVRLLTITPQKLLVVKTKIFLTTRA